MAVSGEDLTRGSVSSRLVDELFISLNPIVFGLFNGLRVPTVLKVSFQVYRHANHITAIGWVAPLVTRVTFSIVCGAFLN